MSKRLAIGVDFRMVLFHGMPVLPPAKQHNNCLSTWHCVVVLYSGNGLLRLSITSCILYYHPHYSSLSSLTFYYDKILLRSTWDSLRLAPYRLYNGRNVWYMVCVCPGITLKVGTRKWEIGNRKWQEGWLACLLTWGYWFWHCFWESIHRWL